MIYCGRNADSQKMMVAEKRYLLSKFDSNFVFFLLSIINFFCFFLSKIDFSVIFSYVLAVNFWFSIVFTVINWFSSDYFCQITIFKVFFCQLLLLHYFFRKKCFLCQITIPNIFFQIPTHFKYSSPWKIDFSFILTVNLRFPNISNYISLSSLLLIFNCFFLSKVDFLAIFFWQITILDCFFFRQKSIFQWFFSVKLRFYLIFFAAKLGFSIVFSVNHRFLMFFSVQNRCFSRKTLGVLAGLGRIWIDSKPSPQR